MLQTRTRTLDEALLSTVICPDISRDHDQGGENANVCVHNVFVPVLWGVIAHIASYCIIAYVAFVFVRLGASHTRIVSASLFVCSRSVWVPVYGHGSGHRHDCLRGHGRRGKREPQVRVRVPGAGTAAGAGARSD
jgi:hypothetical protein